jgi:hypothetical protein
LNFDGTVAVLPPRRHRGRDALARDAAPADYGADGAAEAERGATKI